MKFLETSFDDYITSSNTKEKQIHKYPNEDIIREKMYDNSLIICGPKGSGKYTYALRLIKPMSEQGLKYEKKFTVLSQKKTEHVYRMSDVHFEVDMELLGCNARILWNDIFNSIMDISSLANKNNIYILCSNFHNIDGELLDVFYYYMQKHLTKIKVNFILLTTEYSFIPENIRNLCGCIQIAQPKNKLLTKVFEMETKKVNMRENRNLKYINERFYGNNSDWNYLLMNTHMTSDGNTISFDNLSKETENEDEKNNSLITKSKSAVKNYERRYFMVIQSLYEQILLFVKDDNKTNTSNGSSFMELREKLYDILIYNLDANEVFADLVYKLIDDDILKDTKRDDIDLFEELQTFSKQYNNNYRPIFHLERLILTLIMLCEE